MKTIELTDMELILVVKAIQVLRNAVSGYATKAKLKEYHDLLNKLYNLI